MAELYELNIKHDKQSQQLKDTAIELHATGNVVTEQVILTTIPAYPRNNRQGI